VAAFDIVIAPAIEPGVLLGLEAHLLEAVATRQSAPVLLIYASAGRTLSLGRYHLYDGATDRGGLTAWRRMTGGRVAGSGEGWLGLALVLPSRTALLSERDAKLKPDQVMNRYVRGLLAGLRALGLDAFYPGRDAVTVDRRELAMCSFECDVSGATLFEATVAVNRGMEEVVHDLERFDPDGQLTCPMYGPDSATKLVRELDRDVSFSDVGDAIGRGYAESFGGGSRRELSALELAQAKRRTATFEDPGWFNLRAPDNAISARMASQLGAAEVRVRLSPEGVIERLALCGDLIANSPGIRAFESEMTGKQLDLPSVSAAVMKIFGHGDNFILGIGELSNLVKLVTRAQ
jgi:lipoate-protein ligase A